jgi:hypothetical protein
MMEFKQLKMTNGEEIIAEILDQQEDEIVARNALKLFRFEPKPDTAYYTFRPWMIMKDDLHDPIQINAIHVVAFCSPSSDLKEQYAYALARLEDDFQEKQQNELDLNDLAETEEFWDEHGFNDSDTDNVISFMDKSKLH